MDNPETHPDAKAVLATDFFRPLASKLLYGAEDLTNEEAEVLLAKALRDAFDSGLSSSLLAVVNAVEAVKLTPGSVLVFKFPPDVPQSQVAALRADLSRISATLQDRVGYQPIIVALPSALEVGAYDFQPVGDPVPEAPVRQHRFVAFDALALRDLVVNALPDDCGTVTVFPTASSIVDGVAVHDVRIALQAGTFDSLVARDDGFLLLRHACLGYAQGLGARLNVSVAPEDRFMLDAPSFSVHP